MVWRVKNAFSFDHKGVPVVLRVGQLLADDDPYVKGHEAHLERAEDAATRTSARDVETATAAPGEARVRTKTRS